MSQRIPLHLSVQGALWHWARYKSADAAIVTESATISFHALATRAAAVHRLIFAMGSKRQTPIGLLVASNIDFLAGLCGVLQAEHTAVILHHGLPVQSLEAVLTNAACTVILTDSSQALGSGIVQVAIKSCDAAPLPNPLAATRFVDDNWGIIYSSGTTGEPKGIVRSDLSVLTELIGWCLELPIRGCDTVYIGRPLFYTGGLVLACATLLTGGTLIAPQSHSPKSYEALLERFPADVAFLVPDQVSQLMSHVATHGSLAGSPRAILTMGAPISPDEKKRIGSVLGCGYVESWGNSEGLGTICGPADVLKRPVSVGRPFLGDFMCVVDDAGSILPVGMNGRMAGRADSTLREYQCRPELTHSVMRNGLVISDDLGYEDAQGYFYITGRTTERFLRNGQPLFSNAIAEKVLAAVPEIREIIVAPLSHPTDGHVPAAVVTLKNSMNDSADLLRKINAELFAGERLVGLRIVTTLPRTATGKIDGPAVSDILNNMEDDMVTALIVVDPQRVYTDPKSELHCADSAQTITKIGTLVAAFQERKAPIIFVRHVHRADGSDLGRMFDYTGEAPEDFNFKEGTDEVQYDGRLKIPVGAAEITKNRYSAFQGTDLDKHLRASRVRTVAICGFMTNFCCESTARDAHDRDYFVDFVLDATGTPGTDNLDERKIRSIVGELLSAGFARIVSAKKYAQSIRQKKAL